LAVSDGVDKASATPRRDIIQADAIEANDAHRMAVFRSMKAIARSIAVGIGLRMSSWSWDCHPVPHRDTHRPGYGTAGKRRGSFASSTIPAVRNVPGLRVMPDQTAH